MDSSLQSAHNERTFIHPYDSSTGGKPPTTPTRQFYPTKIPQKRPPVQQGRPIEPETVTVPQSQPILYRKRTYLSMKYEI